jgi:hypothetical protein
MINQTPAEISHDRFLNQTLTNVLQQLNLQRIDALLFECIKEKPREFNNRQINENTLFNLVNPHILIRNPHLPRRLLIDTIHQICDDFLYEHRGITLPTTNSPSEFWQIIIE